MVEYRERKVKEGRCDEEAAPVGANDLWYHTGQLWVSRSTFSVWLGVLEPGWWVWRPVIWTFCLQFGSDSRQLDINILGYDMILLNIRTLIREILVNTKGWAKKTAIIERKSSTLCLFYPKFCIRGAKSLNNNPSKQLNFYNKTWAKQLITWINGACQRAQVYWAPYQSGDRLKCTNNLRAW